VSDLVLSEESKSPDDFVINHGTELLLKRWDRDLPEDKRIYGMKFLFAGGEVKIRREGLYRIGVRHISLSYMYARQWMKKSSVQELADDLGRFDFVFLESGGYSFKNSNKHKSESTWRSIRSYAEEYYEDLERIGHLFAGCTEVDVFDDDFGQKEMEALRKPLLDKGISIVPVIQQQSVEDITSLGWFEDYSYIGISPLLVGNERYKGKLNAIFREARDKNILLHGLGVTDSKTIQGRYPFYSVDSTTYLNGTKYGSTIIFQNGRLRFYDSKKKSVRKRYRKRLEDNGIIWRDVENDKSLEVTLMNSLAYKQLNDYLKYNVNPAYWLTSEEKDRAVSLRSKAFNAEGLIDRKASIKRAQFRRLTVVDDATYDDRAHETLHCNTCYLTGRCPRYKEGQPCGYDINIRLETKSDLQLALKIMLEAEYGRVMTGVLFEKMEGGVLDRNVSEEMQRFIGMVKSARDIFNVREEEITIKAKGRKGAVSQMLASVFNPKSGGNTVTERRANQIENNVEWNGEVVEKNE
jgi:hypothetical protein